MDQLAEQPPLPVQSPEVAQPEPVAQPGQPTTVAEGAGDKESATAAGGDGKKDGEPAKKKDAPTTEPEVVEAEATQEKWQAKLTEGQKKCHQEWCDAVILVESANKDNILYGKDSPVVKAINAHNWTEKDPRSGFRQEDELYTDPDNPGAGRVLPYGRQIKPVMDALEEMIKSDKTSTEQKAEAQKHLAYLQPRFGEKRDAKGNIVTDAKGETLYGFDTREVRDSVVLTEQYCLPLLRRIKDAIKVKDPLKNAQYRDAYCQIVNEIRMLINPRSGLDFDVKLQLVNELLNKDQVQEVLSSIPPVDARYRDQTGKVRGEVVPTQDLVAELRIKYNEVTDMRKKNLVADWLISEMKIAGIEVSEADRGKIAQHTGLELTTKLEKANFENWIHSTGTINKLREAVLGAPGRIDLDSAPLKELVKNKQALAIIGEKFVGGNEDLDKYLDGEEMKKLGLLEKKFAIEQYAMYFMILYGMLGPSIFEGLGEGGSEATPAQAAA